MRIAERLEINDKLFGPIALAQVFNSFPHLLRYGVRSCGA
jgi:hypothetical protein